MLRKKKKAWKSFIMVLKRFIFKGTAMPKSNENIVNNHAENSMKADGGQDHNEDDVFTNENDISRLQISSLNQPTDHVFSPVVSLNERSCTSLSIPCHRSSGLTQSEIIQSENYGKSALGNSGDVSCIVSSGIKRRPSYASKAPSALTHLPKVINDIDNSSDDVNQNQFQTTANFDDHQLSSEKVLLNIQSQPRYDLDEYSNPGTPTRNLFQNGSSSPTQRSMLKNAKVMKIKELQNHSKWDAAVKFDILSVRCRDKVGELYKMRFGSGSKGKCIKVYKSNEVVV